METIVIIDDRDIATLDNVRALLADQWREARVTGQRDRARELKPLMDDLAELRAYLANTRETTSHRDPFGVPVTWRI